MTVATDLNTDELATLAQACATLLEGGHVPVYGDDTVERLVAQAAELVGDPRVHACQFSRKVAARSLERHISSDPTAPFQTATVL